jgi:hypothetical protein
MLIPTRIKFKLPHTMSYPIGAESISEAFFGIPQYEKLIISFTTTNFAFGADFHEARKQNNPYKVFEVSMVRPLKHLTSGKQFVEEGFYDENWEVHVYPVPKEFRSNANVLLLTTVLPKAKLWLQEPRTETWKTGRKHFHALLKEIDNEISIKQD